MPATQQDWSYFIRELNLTPVSSSTGQAPIQFKDEGTNDSTAGAFTTINFVGTGAIVTDAGGGTLLVTAPTTRSLIDNTVGAYVNASASPFIRNTTLAFNCGPGSTVCDTSPPYTQVYVGDVIAITMDNAAVHTTVVTAASVITTVAFSVPTTFFSSAGNAVVITRTPLNDSAYYLLNCSGQAGNTETIYVASGLSVLSITDSFGTGSSSTFSSAGTTFASMDTTNASNTSVVNNLQTSSLLIGGTASAGISGIYTCEVAGRGSVLCGLATATTGLTTSTLSNAGDFSLLLGSSSVGAALTGSFNISPPAVGSMLMGYSSGGTVTQIGSASAAFVFCSDLVGTTSVSLSGTATLTRLFIGNAGMAYTGNSSCANIGIAAGGAVTASITGACVTLALNASAAATVTVSGNSAAGFINSPGASTILLSGGASLTNVVIGNNGSVTASGLGSRVQGRNASNTAGVTLSATANAASVRAYILLAATANATAIGDASRAEGYVPGANALTASGRCSLAWGDTTLNPISATAINAVQFFPGVNAVAHSLQVGPAGGGVMLHGITPVTAALGIGAVPVPVANGFLGVGPVPAGAGNGSIWVDAAGFLCIMDAGAPAGRYI